MFGGEVLCYREPIGGGTMRELYGTRVIREYENAY